MKKFLGKGEAAHKAAEQAAEEVAQRAAARLRIAEETARTATARQLTEELEELCVCLLEATRCHRNEQPTQRS